MFPQEYINCGKIVHTDTSVMIYRNLYDCRSLPNIPSGRILDAYWQGNHVVVKVEDRYSYVYEDFSDYKYFW